MMMCYDCKSAIFASKPSSPKVIARIVVALKLSLQNQPGFKAAFPAP